MSFWNYRVVRHSIGEDEELSLHEAHYDQGDDPAGRPRAITANPVTTGAESVEALRQVLDWMGQALDKPVLEYKDF